MGKIVKLCSSCDEGFAEKFVFCPNCGSTLQAFEMNPVQAPAEPVKQAAPEPVREMAPEPTPSYTEPVIEEAPVVAAAPEVDEPMLELDEPQAEPITAAEADTEEEAEATYVPVPTAQPVYTQPAAVDVDRAPRSLESEHAKFQKEGGFYVTVIEEKNVGTKIGLLAVTTGGVVVLMLGMLVYSIFAKQFDVNAIGEYNSLASIMDDVPTVVEEEQKKNTDKSAGGGGGGGRQQEETTLGDLANQTKNPVRPPEAIPRLDNPLPLPPASTEGNKTFEQKYDRYGDPNGRFTNWNNGPGTGGGQGTGTGTGQGSGRGTGAGSGTGSGYGGGLGNGNGNGVGDGDDGNGGAPPPKVAGVTQGIKILSKPRPGYTDSARQNNIQGTVILRVTFMANGSVGGVSAVKGLPDGLTEQAIAAARRISFEPAKVNGVAQSVTKQIEYTFSIY